MADLFQFLNDHSISFERFDHPPVFTCEEANRLIPDLPGAKTKNLFTRDQKGKRHFLIVVPDHKQVDLKALGKALGTSGLSMGSPERLKKHLGIEPGSVSLLAIVNDQDGNVELVIDQDIWDAEAFQAHPLVNTSTLIISKPDMERFLTATSHEPTVLSVPER